MPWRNQAKKDVASCDKLRGGASNLRSGDFRMGEPTGRERPVSGGESIAVGSEPGEVNHLSTRRKRKQP
jgi:hypothetical protein